MSRPVAWPRLTRRRLRAAGCRSAPSPEPRRSRASVLGALEARGVDIVMASASNPQSLLAGGKTVRLVPEDWVVTPPDLRDRQSPARRPASRWSGSTTST